MRVEVRTTSPGPAGELVPRSIGFGPRDVGVTAVLDRWPGDGYCYVKVKGDDGSVYILRHDEAEDAWRLTLFERADAEGMS